MRAFFFETLEITFTYGKQKQNSFDIPLFDRFSRFWGISYFSRNFDDFLDISGISSFQGYFQDYWFCPSKGEYLFFLTEGVKPLTFPPAQQPWTHSYSIFSTPSRFLLASDHACSLVASKWRQFKYTFGWRGANKQTNKQWCFILYKTWYKYHFLDLMIDEASRTNWMSYQKQNSAK